MIDTSPTEAVLFTVVSMVRVEPCTTVMYGQAAPPKGREGGLAWAGGLLRVVVIAVPFKRGIPLTVGRLASVLATLQVDAVGLSARRVARTPAACGAENEVPETVPFRVVGSGFTAHPGAYTDSADPESERLSRAAAVELSVSVAPTDTKLQERAEGAMFTGAFEFPPALTMSTSGPWPAANVLCNCNA